MNTISRKPRSVKPAAGVCSLILVVNGTHYQVVTLTPHPEVASKAIRLRKFDGQTYDLAVTPHGQECSCPDFIFSRDGKDPRGCKHLVSARAWGLFPPLPPANGHANGQGGIWVELHADGRIEGPITGKPSPLAQRFRSTADLARNDPDAYRALQGDWAGYPDAEPMTDDDQQQMADYYDQD